MSVVAKGSCEADMSLCKDWPSQLLLQHCKHVQSRHAQGTLYKLDNLLLSSASHRKLALRFLRGFVSEKALSCVRQGGSQLLLSGSRGCEQE